MQLHRLTFSTRHSTEIRDDLDRPKRKQATELTTIYNGTDNIAYTKSVDNLAATNDIAMTNRDNGAQDVISSPREEMSGFKRALFCICGVTKSQLDDEENAANMVSTVSPAQQAMEAADSLKEHPLWGNVCTVNAVILMLICAFIWGFYA